MSFFRTKFKTEACTTKIETSLSPMGEADNIDISTKLANDNPKKFLEHAKLFISASPQLMTQAALYDYLNKNHIAIQFEQINKSQLREAIVNNLISHMDESEFNTYYQSLKNANGVAIFKGSVPLDNGLLNQDESKAEILSEVYEPVYITDDFFKNALKCVPIPKLLDIRANCCLLSANAIFSEEANALIDRIDKMECMQDVYTPPVPRFTFR